MAKRVYFAFYYGDVIDFRANVVRKHNFAEGVESAGYYDYSIWEAAKNTSPSSLKRLIDAELEGTTVTVILIGTLTWARRWVRYEIFKSLHRANQVIGININSIKGKDQNTKPQGPNPFNNLALKFDGEGSIVAPWEWKDQAWRPYTDMEPYTLSTRPHSLRGQFLRLTYWCPVYDWIADNGYQNFESWIDS
jgi:hypothetical protein